MARQLGPVLQFRGNNDAYCVSALVVPSGYVSGIMVLLLAIGALAGAIGSGIAASRFLDV